LFRGMSTSVFDKWNYLSHSLKKQWLFDEILV
jgi:hypothetical protein